MRQPRLCKSANIVSAGSLGSGRLPGAQNRESDLGHEAKLRDLEVVKNVHRDAALAIHLFFVSCALMSLSLSVTGERRRETKRGQRRFFCLVRLNQLIAVGHR